MTNTTNVVTDAGVELVNKPLYDVHREGPAELADPFLTHQMVKDFCEAADVHFLAVGHPEDWDDKSVFRVGTNTVPASGHTIPFTMVREWYNALQLMGDKGTSGEVYYHYKTGNRYTTLFEAIDTETGGTVVIYENDEGDRFARPKKVFFSVVRVDGAFAPRFMAASAKDNAPDFRSEPVTED